MLVHVRHEPHGRGRREDVRAARQVLLDDVVLGGAVEALRIDATKKRLPMSNRKLSRRTSGQIVTDVATSSGCSWGDFDNDGFLDLFVPNTPYDCCPDSGRNFLYRHNGDGTFLAITSSIVVTEALDHEVGIWGDFDNDGFLDLFVTSAQKNSLFKNLGNDTFAKAKAGSLVSEVAAFELEIQEGGQASMEFLLVYYGDVPEADRQKVRGQLERYCGQDTEGMIWIVDALRRLLG
jgi:hypothetical protein